MRRIFFLLLVSFLFLVKSPPKRLARLISFFYGCLAIQIVYVLATMPVADMASALWQSKFSDPLLLCLCSYIMLLSATASLFFRGVVVPAEVKIALHDRRYGR